MRAMNVKCILGLVTAGFMVNCSSGSSGGGSSTSAGAQAVLNMQSKMNSLDSLLPSQSSSFVANNLFSARAAIGSNWTTATMPSPTDSGDCTGGTPAAVSLKDWMGYEFNADATRCNGSSINVFGRIKQATMVLCAILQSQSATTSADFPSSGSVTQTFDSTFISKAESVCGLASTDAADLSGLVATITFSTPSDTSTFDRKINVNIGSGTIDNDVYVKFDSAGNTAVATTESNSNGRTRTLMTYNATTKVLRGEYVSRSASSPNPVYVHRLYMDATNSSARVYSYITDNTNTISYDVSGYPGLSSDVAFAMGVTGYGFGSPVSGEACVDPNTGNITTDNTTTCGSYSSVAVSSATAGSTVKSNVDGHISTWNDFATTPTINWADIAEMLVNDI